MVDSFYWNPVGSWIPNHKNLFGTFSYQAHFRAQISSNGFWTWSNVSVEPFWQDEVGCKCRAFLTRWGWMWVLDLSDMGFGCVPAMVRCECWACLFDMVLECVPPMVKCKCWAGISDMVHSMVRHKCWRQWRPTWRLGLQPTWKRVGSVELTVTSRIER